MLSPKSFDLQKNIDFSEEKLNFDHITVLEQLTKYDKDYAEEHFDALADHYEGAYTRAGYPDPEKCAEYVDQLTRQFGFNKNAKILDFACGPGLTGQSLKERGFSNIIGIDIS